MLSADHPRERLSPKARRKHRRLSADILWRVIKQRVTVYLRQKKSLDWQAESDDARACYAAANKKAATEYDASVIIALPMAAVKPIGYVITEASPPLPRQLW